MPEILDLTNTPIMGQTLTRAHLEALIAASTTPLVFEGCDFEGADLREADISGLKLVDAKLFRGATISLNQAAALLSDLGIAVA